MGILVAAQDYLRRGFSLIPCLPRDKRPSIAWQEYQRRKPSEAELNTWFGDGQEHNLAIITGAVSGLVVLDVDTGGQYSLAGKELPPTPCVRTANGWHYFFKHPGYPVRNFARRLPGIDLRGDGGYVLAPPSIHPSGVAYEWALSPEDIPLADPPQWLLDLLEKPEQAKPPHWLTQALQGVPEGQRNDTAIRIAGYLRRKGMAGEVALEFLRLWNANNNPPLPEDELQAVVNSAKKMSVPWREARRMTAAELLATKFEPQKWLVTDLLPEGSLLLLASKAKLGKTWLMLQLATAMAAGGRFLGYEVECNKVLYVALEDGLRGIQERLRLQGAPAGMENFIFYDAMPPLNTPEGFDQLESWIELERPKMVVIDTLASAKTGRLDENDAGQVGDLVNPLRDLAHEKNIAILLVYHHNKIVSGDAVLDLRGSSALGAAADTIWGLYRERGQTRAKLDGTGRNIKEFSLALEFDLGMQCWLLLGETKEVAANEAEADIVEVLQELGEADAKTIANELGKSRTGVRKVLVQMALQGKVVSTVLPAERRRGQKVVYHLPYRELKKCDSGDTVNSVTVGDRVTVLPSQHCYSVTLSQDTREGTKTFGGKLEMGSQSQSVEPTPPFGGQTPSHFADDPRPDLEQDHAGRWGCGG